MCEIVVQIVATGFQVVQMFGDCAAAFISSYTNVYCMCIRRMVPKNNFPHRTVPPQMVCQMYRAQYHLAHGSMSRVRAA